MKFKKELFSFLAFLSVLQKQLFAQSICPPGYQINSGSCTVIQCPRGQYFDSNQSQCANCDQACSACNYYPTYCTQCQKGFYLYQNQCLTQCPQAQTYISCNGSSCICQACDPSCLQCFGNRNTQCLACSVGFYYNQINSSCLKQCEDGYTQQILNIGSSQQLICIPCDSNCRTCNQTNAQYCLTCKDNMYLNTVTNACVSTCPNLQYKINGICKNCPTGCQSCYNTNPSNPQTVESCLSCVSGYFLDIENQLCVKNCASGYVVEGLTQRCLPCNSTCKNCSDSTNQGCLQCQNGYSLTAGSPSSCQNACAVGNYQNNSLCLTCNTACQECFGADNQQCTVCKTGYYLYKTQCLVICPVSFYTYARQFSDSTKQPICDYCPNEMEQCEQDKTNLGIVKPILCKRGYYLQNGACILKCSDQTYYQDEATRSCLPCVFPCLTCLSASMCLTCATYTPNGQSQGQTYLFAQITYNGSQGTVFQQNCVPACPKGFYQNKNSCSQCNQLCQTCQGPAQTDCITCQQYDSNNMLFKYSNQCYYTCPSSQTNPMYGDIATQACLPCSQECSSCFNGNNKSCYSCVNGYFLEYLEPECKSFCASDGTYMNLQTNQCSLCGFGCSSCTNGAFNSCISCQKGYYLQQNYNVCNPCPQQCASCTNMTTCQSCNQGYFLQSQTNSCVQQCPLIGFYVDTKQQACIPCDSSCLECYGGANNQCISCPKGSYLITDGTCSLCSQCNSGNECVGPNTTDCLNQPTCNSDQYLYDGQCLTCFPYCSTCSGTTYDSCINCQTTTDYTLLFDVCKKKASQTDTQCDIGFYYDSVNKQCYSCHQNCLQCYEKSSSQCTKCASGYLLHLDITTCSNTCLDGYYQQDPSIPQCSPCLYNCINGCSSGYQFLLGLCFTQCPFGTIAQKENCSFNTKPSIQFAKTLGNSVNNNSQTINLQLFVYSKNLFSIKWRLFNGNTDISNGPLQSYIQNRLDYIILPPKSLQSNTQYTIQASILDLASNCQSENDCMIQQSFQTMNAIAQGSYNIEINSAQLSLTLIISRWLFNSVPDNLNFDFYVKLTGNDYFFFDKGQRYSDGRFTYLIPNLSYDLSENKAQFFLVVYNDYDVQISQLKMVLNVNLQQITISLDEFLDSVYSQITTLQQIQSLSYQFYTQMQNLMSSQTASQTIFNRHLFYQVYSSLKGVQMPCDSKINCSGNGKCIWSQDNYNEILCICNINYAGRYCQFQSYQLDVARQHLIALTDLVSNIPISKSSDLFFTVEVLLELTYFYSIFDEFTLNTLINVYFQVFDQLQRVQSNISDEKILFKISKLTSQLINLINEDQTLSYNDQQSLLMKTMKYFDSQINLFLQNFAKSYDDLKSQEQVETSYQTDISYINLNFIYQNDLLDAYMANNGVQDGQQPIQIVFQGDQISYTFDVTQFSPKSSLSAAVIKWKSNPFLSQSQYQAPFISCITELVIYSQQTEIQISTVSQIVEIAIPKILPTPILQAIRPFYQPYTCIYFDSVSQVYKQDGVQYLRENSTHVICGSEQISGNYGVIVNQDQIDPNLSLITIWNATQQIYADDQQFINYISQLMNSNNNNGTNNNTEISQSSFNPNLSLLYALLIYVIFITIFVLISIVRDRNDQETYIKESDSYWLVHPIYSLIFGPYSNFFPRLQRSINYAQLIINLFLYNSIFVLVYSLPSEQELQQNLGKRQIISIQISATSVACSIVTYYLTICMVNLFKMKWYIKQKWLEFKQDKITTEIVEQVTKSLKIFHLMNYGLAFMLQAGMGIPIIILILSFNSQQNQFFFTSVFASFIIDNVLDIIVLISFCFIKIFSQSEKSKIILLFTLRGFYYPVYEFLDIEAKIKEYQQKGEVLPAEQANNNSDEDIFEINEDINTPKRIFKKSEEKPDKAQEEIQLNEFVSNLKTNQ
ncbi:hypothetical protein ABPG72_010119 [Tetrahymena utriculariae]